MTERDYPDYVTVNRENLLSYCCLMKFELYVFFEIET